MTKAAYIRHVFVFVACVVVLLVALLALAMEEKSMHWQPYCYRAKVLRVIDGDTLDVCVDGGFGNSRVERLRLLNINAPEMKGETRKAAELSTDALKELIRNATDRQGYICIQTEKDDAFGRYLATIYLPSGETVNQAMLDGGFATEWKR